MSKLRRQHDGGVHRERRAVEIGLLDRQMFGDEVEDVAAGAGDEPVAAHTDRAMRAAEHEVRIRRNDDAGLLSG